MLDVPGLPAPLNYTIRLSGDRDASTINATYGEYLLPEYINFPRHIRYYGEQLFQWAPATGNWSYSSAGDHAVTTSITWNVGLLRAQQDLGEMTHKGHQLFDLWEDNVRRIVMEKFVVEPGSSLPFSQFQKWGAILGDYDGSHIALYLEEPMEGRIKSIDEVMRYIRDGWQSMLLIDPDYGDLRLVCLLDEPSPAPEMRWMDLSVDFDYQYDPEELIQIRVIDVGTLFLPIDKIIPEGVPIPQVLRDEFPRQVVTRRISVEEAKLEVALQRARNAASTKSASATLPAPHSVDELRMLMPGRGVTLNEMKFWITECSVSWPGDTVSLTLYRYGE